jgi:catechol 2,3-dioxygenase-like lactoylglutathione lyase family enzyme
LEALRLTWIGTRTGAYAETLAFFRDVLRLPIGTLRPSFVRFDLPDDSSIEVFQPGGPDDHAYFTSGPVVGMEVGDFDRAKSELGRARIPLLGEAGGEIGGYRWQHFRAPDGAIYEIVDYPARKSPKGGAVGPCGVVGFGWVGTRTPAYAAMRGFVADVLGLELREEETGLAEFGFPNGDVLEVFHAGGPFDHPHLTTGPMPGLVVEDLDRAEEELRCHHLEILARKRSGKSGWSHFRAPDGCVYEIKRFGEGGTGRWSPP